MSVPSAVWQFGSAQGVGPKEQGSQIRATRFARIMGFRSQRIVVMFPHANVDLVNCAQLLISRCCRLVPIKPTDRGGGGDTTATAGI
jgi:hypothetical protein